MLQAQEEIVVSRIWLTPLIMQILYKRGAVVTLPPLIILKERSNPAPFCFLNREMPTFFETAQGYKSLVKEDTFPGLSLHCIGNVDTHMSVDSTVGPGTQVWCHNTQSCTTSFGFETQSLLHSLVWMAVGE